MIVGIPTDDGKTVSDHFGRSKQFAIAEVESGTVGLVTMVDNPHASEATEQGGHGKLLKMLRDRKVEVVVCSNLNPRMQNDLEKLGIRVERCTPRSSIDSVLARR